MDRGKDGTEIYGGSIAMNKFYDKLTQELDSVKFTKYRIIVINALTLIRNNYDSKQSTYENNCNTDLQTLIAHLSTYVRKKQADERKVSVIVMYPDYKKLPEPLQRPYSAEMKRLVPIYKTDAKCVRAGLDLFYEGGEVNVYSFKAGDLMTYPHQELAKLLRKGEKVPFRIDDPIHLVSHISLDWHLGAYFKNVYLLESYTAEIVPKTYFGSKLTGLKQVKVPFNSVVHQVFGDKTLIKPLAVRKTKKTLLESALKWSMMSDSKIMSITSETLGLPPSSLTKYKFV